MIERWMVDFIAGLETRRFEECDAVAVVTVDEGGYVVNAVGPFVDGPSALAYTAKLEEMLQGRMSDYAHVIVPMFKPPPTRGEEEA